MRKHKHKNRFAYSANNAYGGCRKRTMLLDMICKITRTVAWVIRGILKGLLRAVKVWTDSAPARGY